MSKKVYRAILSSLIVLSGLIPLSPQAQAGNATGCFAKGIYLQGKVQVVNSFPDLKVQIVKSFPDIKVQQVKSFPNSCGKWQFVNSFPDFKIKIVTSFPDIKVQMVRSFPGVR